METAKLIWCFRPDTDPHILLLLKSSVVFYLHVVYFLKGHYRPLFLYFRLFYNRLTENIASIKLPMTGFEPRTSGVGSNRSAN